MKRRTPPPATAADIGHIRGPLEDAVLSEIVALGATASEVLEAFTWATADDQIGEKWTLTKFP